MFGLTGASASTPLSTQLLTGEQSPEVREASHAQRLTSIPGPRFWLHRDQPQRLRLQRIGLRHLAERGLAMIGVHHARVPTARPQMSQQRPKTLDRYTVRRR